MPNNEDAEQKLREISESIGLPLAIVSAEEAENADMVVCVSGQGFYFTDNVFAVCADCGGCIQHRQFVPKKPPKLCFGCARRRVENGGG